ncbi:MAG: hypothetical protein M1575_01515 [Patescibacteria group bacterium]|nr:hypothetical protein [Patescibacteria group bacterium]
MKDLKEIRSVIPLIIWWCEGTKPRRDKRWKNAVLCPIEVSNTDPKIIKIFRDYLVQELGVSEKGIKGQLQVHEGDNKSELEIYWSKITDIPLSQFNKTIIRKIGNKPGKSKGTFKLRFYNKRVYKKLESSLTKFLKLFNGV